METIAISELIPDDHNANKGSARGRGMLEKSINKYGFGRSILIDKNNKIIAGNKTTETAGAVGYEKVRIIETDGKEIIAVKRMDLDLDNDKAARELAFADNRVSEVSMNWEPEEISRAQVDGIDLSNMFTQEEISAITGQELIEGDTDANDIGAVPEVAKCKKGDLWILGEHRLLCGNSGDVDNIARVMQADFANCIFTDPPYGVSIGKKNVMLNSFQPFGRNLTDIESDDLSPEDLLKILLPIFKIIKTNVMADDCTLFMTAPQGGELSMMMMMMMKDSGLPCRHMLIWKKNCATFSMGRLDYDYQHEPILLTWGKKHKRPMAGQFHTSVWEIDKPRACKEHPKMKPVELYVNAYLNNSDLNDIVFDPFCGSGTCIIAAEQTTRKARGIELSPHYCDVIIDRWTKFANKNAKREDGALWGEL